MIKMLSRLYGRGAGTTVCAEYYYFYFRTLRRGAFYSTKNTRRGEKGISVFVSDACVPLVNLPKVITETENIYQVGV